MPEGTDDPRLSAEGELALARLALDEGDLRHAADHIAGAIVHVPTMPEVHELLARLAARAGGGLDLFPLDDHVYIGTVVARAHLLASAGRPAEGLQLLAAAAGHAPAADWAGVPWVSAPDLAARIDPDHLARILMQVCAAIPDPVPEADRAPLRPYLRLARQAVLAYPRHGLLLGAASALARRTGEVAPAVEWAEQGVRAAPSKLGEVWLGYAYRSAGRTTDALAALRRAVEHDPDDLSVYADIAGTLADNGHLDEAIEWIDRALARDASFDCAVHTAHRLRHLRDGRLDHLVALADFQRDHPDNSHEHTDLAECCQGKPWLGLLPPASEAVIDVLRQVLAAEGPTSGGELRLDALEPPSAMRTVIAALPDLTVTVTEVPAPDIREPRRPTDRPLWRYAGTSALPARPAPSAAAVERIRRLAGPTWPHPPAAYDAAVELAILDVDDLLGLLVHPPAPPPTELGRVLARHEPALWVRSVQVWACLGLLHHRTDEPWLTSARRQLLVDLAWDVEDWITEAALFALVTAAWVDPAVRPDVTALVGRRFADGAEVARHRPVSIAWSLANLALATPGMDPAVLDAAREIIAADAAAAPPEAGGTPTDSGQAAGGPGSGAAPPRQRGRLRRWLARRR